jgi:UDP-glucose 4-epimerase
MAILVTGGAGFIGSMTCVRLIEAGMTPIILDNFCNSKRSVVDRIEEITGVRPVVIDADIRNRALLDRTLAGHGIDAVIHFAGLKAVGDSVANPLAYYENNVGGTLTLMQALDAAAIKTLIFSSSATVYGDPANVPIFEGFPTGATNPYGRTKLMAEEILQDMALADPGWSVSLLRYFNPVGAHPSGLMGEDPQGVPNNLLPFIAQVAVGRRAFLTVYGNDYPTPDGTGQRDYIHVLDVADAHIAALKHALNFRGAHIFNLGTGQGHSVLEMLAAFELACGHPLAYKVAARRPGDVAACWASPAKATKELGWSAQLTLEQMCADAWRWQSENPNGYPD